MPLGAPWSPASHLPHTSHLCGACNMVSSTVPPGTNRCAQCSQVAACPWPEPASGPRRRTEGEALQRRIEGALTPSQGQAGPAGPTFWGTNVHLRDPTSVAHSRHVFLPYPPPNAAHCRAHNTMPRRQGNGPAHPRAGRRAQQATMPDMVVGAVAEAHVAHAAALHDLPGSAGAFLGKAILPTVWALNRAGALTLLPAMHRVAKAVRSGHVDPEAALYGYWMD